MLAAVTSITSTNPRQSTACPLRPANRLPLALADTVGADAVGRPQDLSMIAADGGRLKVYTS
jgi:hypothetical protein